MKILSQVRRCVAEFAIRHLMNTKPGNSCYINPLYRSNGLNCAGNCPPSHRIVEMEKFAIRHVKEPQAVDKVKFNLMRLQQIK